METVLALSRAMHKQIDLAIDDACGHNQDKEAFPDFISFVYECICSPIRDSVKV